MSKEDRMAILEGLQASELPPAQPFYSQLSRTLEAKMPKSSTPAQVLQIAQGGSKAEEIKWSGLVPKLQSMGPKVDKAELLAWLADEGSVRFEEVNLSDQDTPEDPELRAKAEALWDEFTKANDIYLSEYRKALSAGMMKDPETSKRLDDLAGKAYDLRQQSTDVSNEAFKTTKPAVPTLFSQYVLPGGSNYREVVLAMPNVGFEEWTKNRGVSDFSKLEAGKQKAMIDQFSREKGLGYTSSHFRDIPNYVAHMRGSTTARMPRGKPGIVHRGNPERPPSGGAGAGIQRRNHQRECAKSRV
jgi:hypothetical protein